MVNNFTNHLYAQAQAYCEAENLDFALLLPLIHETVDRLHDFPARSMQTGPAARGDQPTIQAHLQLLNEMPHLAQLYSFLTNSILSERGEKL
jgi:predicted short-subunit dehydrogenase-like oxidoreductase (DUF2520 family)